ncbi:MAG: 50S ribosomal protein L19e [Nanoarchaeota archaeon]
MNIKNQRRVASKLLKIGKKRVKFDIEKLAEIKEAITKSDLRSLIAKKIIKSKKQKGHSRVRSRKIKRQKKKGQRKGPGSRKGKQTSRLSRKKRWMIKVRAQRKFIKSLRGNKKITSQVYNDIYNKIKSNRFRTTRLIKLYLEENKLVNKNAIQKKN